MDLERFYQLLETKKKFRWAIPLCCFRDTKVQDISKAKRVYNWMRMACYQYSVLNVILSLVMISLLFWGEVKSIKVGNLFEIASVI